jgi:hypothetical protein
MIDADAADREAKRLKGRNVVERLIDVMGEIGAIGKNRKAPGLNYAFRGIDDILPDAQVLCVKHGVLHMPRVLERERETVMTRGGTPMVSVRLLIEHTFTAPDMTSVKAVTVGEAMDSGDKATNKAHTAALKLALTEGLLIPTHESDRDTEEHSPEIAAPLKAKPAAAKPPDPPKAPAPGPANKPTTVAMPITESGRVPTFTPTQLDEAADLVTREVGTLRALAQTAMRGADIEALRPRYNALQKVLPRPEWTALGESLKARKTELPS